MPFFAEAQSSSIAAPTEISAANIVPTDAIPPDAEQRTARTRAAGELSATAAQVFKKIVHECI